jgi:dTDP-4-dehydrorhamnose 3,5-epimerase
LFELKSSKLSGCFELQPKAFDDARGRFVKVFHEQAFAENGLATEFAEEYYSISHKNVIRGLHFQLPPMDHVKMVYCVHGEVIDAVVDLRTESPTYRHHALFKLSAAKANCIYIPKGMAHGFCVVSEQAIMVYKVGSTYSPRHDAGVLWSSADIPWPVDNPCISDRDNSFPKLADFSSPF